MLHEDPGNISYSAVGGLSDQIRELRESIELPLMNPELFLRVGIKPPKVPLNMQFWILFLAWLLYGRFYKL
jgi:ATP-dependent 26S proteasome regulatory subunit